MPKQKTHSGAKKRFKVTGSGKLMKQQAGMRHNLEGKASSARVASTRTRCWRRPTTKVAKKLLGR